MNDGPIKEVYRMTWTISAAGDKEAVAQDVRRQAANIGAQSAHENEQTESFADHVAATLEKVGDGVQVSISASGALGPDGTGFESVSMTFSRPMAGGTG